MWVSSSSWAHLCRLFAPIAEPWHVPPAEPWHVPPKVRFVLVHYPMLDDLGVSEDECDRLALDARAHVERTHVLERRAYYEVMAKGTSVKRSLPRSGQQCLGSLGSSIFALKPLGAAQQS